MATFTTQLGERDLNKLKLPEKEAWEMLREGFRFSMFDPTTDDYRLSAPYRLLNNIDKDTLTLEQ